MRKQILILLLGALPAVSTVSAVPANSTGYGAQPGKQSNGGTTPDGAWRRGSSVVA